MSDLDTTKLKYSEQIVDIVDNSEDQVQLTDKLTELRRNAYIDGNKYIFDEVFMSMQRYYNSQEDFQTRGFFLTYNYSLEDFQNSDEPYRDVFEQENSFLQQRALERMAAMAKKAGFKSFKKTYSAYVKSLKQVNSSSSYSLNPTDFPGQPMELEAGSWQCDESGVRKVGVFSEEIACLHPIMPIERLVNIDTNEEKLKIAYCKGYKWRTLIAGKNELFDRSKVIKLSALGVSVASNSAASLSEFLCEIEALNYDRIPEVESVTRLGYIGDGSFSPYVDGLVFDGESDYKTLYNAVSIKRGNYEAWKESALKCRSDSVTAQILLVASFASPLIKKIGALPFFVHLWGNASGTGKTVALMAAGSVWGDPELGKFVQTFNATQVGHERFAAFLNNMPMCIDELQLSKDSHGRSKFDVYQLAQGVGRTRGNKSGGIDKTPTWSLCILTTGESPIVKESAGAGAVNRVIDIECNSGNVVIARGTGSERARELKDNYGHAGEIYIRSLTDEIIDEAREKYNKYFRDLSMGETTEKQAMAAAMILVGDELADRFIFKTGKHLTVSDISEFLKTKAAVSVGQRGYSYMCSWVAMNANKFKADNENADVYGLIQDDWVYINQAVFRKAAQDAEFDDRAVLSWLKSNGLILTRGRRFTRGKRINGVNVECVVMKLPDADSEELNSIEGFEELI